MVRDGRRTRLTSTALVSAIHGSPQLRTRQLRQRYTVYEATGVRADGDIIGNRNLYRAVQRRLQCRRGSRWLAKSRAVDSGLKHRWNRACCDTETRATSANTDRSQHGRGRHRIMRGRMTAPIPGAGHRSLWTTADSPSGLCFGQRDVYSSHYSSPAIEPHSISSRVAARLEATLFGYAYERVDALCVHSNMEIQLYHDYFSIPKDRIRLSLWS